MHLSNSLEWLNNYGYGQILLYSLDCYHSICVWILFHKYTKLKPHFISLRKHQEMITWRPCDQNDVQVINSKIKRSFTHELSFGFWPFWSCVFCGHSYRSESLPFAMIERSLVAWNRRWPIKGKKHGGVVRAWKCVCIQQLVSP